MAELVKQIFAKFGKTLCHFAFHCRQKFANRNIYGTFSFILGARYRKIHQWLLFNLFKKFIYKTFLYSFLYIFTKIQIYAYSVIISVIYHKYIKMQVLGKNFVTKINDLVV